MNEKYHIEIEYLLKEIHVLKAQLKVAKQGLNALIENGDLLGIAQKTLDAIDKELEK